jgi:hypothetical protein
LDGHQSQSGILLGSAKGVGVMEMGTDVRGETNSIYQYNFSGRFLHSWCGIGKRTVAQGPITENRFHIGNIKTED